jgi:hypothetical protein
MKASSAACRARRLGDAIDGLVVKDLEGGVNVARLFVQAVLQQLDQFATITLGKNHVAFRSAARKAADGDGFDGLSGSAQLLAPETIALCQQVRDGGGGHRQNLSWRFEGVRWIVVGASSVRDGLFGCPDEYHLYCRLTMKLFSMYEL